jgi:hypothetical protein
MNIVDVMDGSFSDAEPDLSLAVGDRVRSYDFAGTRDCYVEGLVEAITPPLEGCARYKIRVERQVLGGVTAPVRAEFVYPPVNGTHTMMGRLTNLVERAPLH